MAIVEVKVPQLSESVAEATIGQWKKKPGEAVVADEILVEIETDKVVLEVPAPSGGVLATIVKGDGSTVVAEEVIATIDTEGKGASAAAAAPAQPRQPRRSSSRGRRRQGGGRDARRGKADGRRRDCARPGRGHRPRRPRHQG